MLYSSTSTSRHMIYTHPHAFAVVAIPLPFLHIPTHFYIFLHMPEQSYTQTFADMTDANYFLKKDLSGKGDKGVFVATKAKEKQLQSLGCPIQCLYCNGVTHTLYLVYMCVCVCIHTHHTRSAMNTNKKTRRKATSTVRQQAENRCRTEGPVTGV